jgi:hypothetical protein
MRIQESDDDIDFFENQDGTLITASLCKKRGGPGASTFVESGPPLMGDQSRVTEWVRFATDFTRQEN